MAKKKITLEFDWAACDYQEMLKHAMSREVCGLFRDGTARIL